MEIKFKRDTAFRKQFFVPESFAHPAKMDAQLLIWLVEHYSEVGETILDPMAGSGTMMLACGLGRHCVLIELEEKFCKMMRDNWNEVKMRPQLGSTMGECRIIQGDARNLEGVLADKIITSPPYTTDLKKDRAWMERHYEGIGRNPKGYTVDQYDYELGGRNIANLPYGNIDKIISSPPYAERHSYPDIERERHAVEKLKAHPDSKIGGVRIHEHYSDNPNNLGNLPYGEIDKIITSPPYEGSLSGIDDEDRAKEFERMRQRGMRFNPLSHSNVTRGTEYSDSLSNIGNLKSTSYLEAMLQVYQQCYKVLKPQGLMILVTKNFIRNKTVIRLDTDTIKLCEQAGFSYLERHYRKLPSQSFWRVIYHQKHPEVEQILNEDVLVFKRD